jgi:hypothetical protein
MAPLRVMLALVLAAHATGFVRASSRNFSRKSRPLAPAASAAPQSQLRHTQIACYDDDDDRLMSIRGGMLSPSRVTLLGAAVNVLLLLLKLVVGSLSGSAALVADAYHSGSDLLVDAVTMFAGACAPLYPTPPTLLRHAPPARTAHLAPPRTASHLYRRLAPPPSRAAPHHRTPRASPTASCGAALASLGAQ